MELELWQIIIAVLGGLIAGIINTLAGNGSAITLTILTELLGLPGNVANGTNRVGIFSQGIISTYIFNKNGKLNLKRSWPYILYIFIGAMLGVWLALNVSNEQFKNVFKYLLVIMFFVILVNPKRWLRDTDEDFKLHPLLAPLVLIPLGFYGGFIQMGMGVLFLIIFVLLMRYNIMEANGVKVFVVFLYTAVVLLIFSLSGLVHWKIGLILAVGQAIGAYIGASFGTKHKQADKWAYRLLIVIVLWGLLRLFNVFEFLGF